jgi:methanogenic corrinoid protein MtbC1
MFVLRRAMGHGGTHDPGECREAMVGKLCRDYAAALLFGDEIAAEKTIRDALDAKLSTAEIDDEIIAPAMWLVGDLWERGELSVAEEHIATEISLRMLALQREAQRLVQTRGDHRVMLAAPAGELHVVALRMIGNLLRNTGYDVVMIGPDVPPEALAIAVLRHRPDVLCLSATMPSAGDRLLLAIEEVQDAWPGVGFVVGGNGVSARVRSRPRIEVCRRVGDAIEAVDALVQRADQN